MLTMGTLIGTQVTWGQAQPPATAPAGLPGAAPVPAGGKKQVLSQVIDVAKLAVRPSDVGNRRDLFDGPTITLNNLEGHISVLNPGQNSHTPHQHVNEEMVIVMEGALDVYINGVVTRAEKGAIMFFSSNDWHGVSNPGTVPAMYYVLNWNTPVRPGMASTAPASAPAIIRP